MTSFEENKELKVITVEELKQFDGLNGVSENEAIQIIEALKELAFISYNLISENNEQLKSLPELCKAK